VKDPKNRPLVYIITGIVAVGAALFFMTIDSGNIFDWFILGMGVVAIVKGVQEYLQQHGGLAGLRKKTDGSGPDGPDSKA
jgi:hypothetical protein